MVKRSNAKQPPKTHRVTLTYGYAVTASNLRTVKKGDKITFRSNQGDLDLVLTPKHRFEKNTFKTGDKPILVTEDGPCKIWCGGDFQVDLPRMPADGHVVIDPRSRKFGTHSEDGP